MAKSGACPVIPNTVVFRYFSCPAKSMNVITWKRFFFTACFREHMIIHNHRWILTKKWNWEFLNSNTIHLRVQYITVLTHLTRNSPNLWGFFTDFYPIQVPMVWFVYNLPWSIKAQNIIAHTAGPPWLHLVLMSEEPLSCHATPVVQIAMCQHP